MNDWMTEQIIVQLPMGLASDDLELRNRAGETIERALAVDSSGEYDGADIGSGTMNLFYYTRREDADRALATIRSVLNQMDLLEVALVARRDAEDDADPMVVFPEQSNRVFEY